jgi:predicted dithiol-disulfide oxidoreductase (DUF899 family)
VGDIGFPGESVEYRAARERLLEREIRLRREIEAVAAERRALPPGGAVPEDYVFQGAGADGTPTDVKLSELFEPGKGSLVIYSFMFPRHPADDRPGPDSGRTADLPLAETPCASCTSILDGLEGAARHLQQRINLVAVARSPLSRILDFADDRGWRHLRLLSSAANTYNRDYLAETADGVQMPMLNVFVKNENGIRHSWGTELLYAPWDEGQEPRHVDFAWPIWHLLDATPEGRGTDSDFPRLSYGSPAPRA